jgi:uncharacterized LabA/DUF88 family protein
MDRVAVLVDAGYFFAAGSALVSGTGKQKRDTIIFDEAQAANALKDFARTITGGLSLLRIYWYDGASRKTGPSAEHVRLAHANDIKVRLGFLNAVGEQKGVDSLIVTDIVELARNRAVADVVLMSGDEDVRIGVQLAQSFGVRVHLLGIKPCAGTQSTQLRQEADTCSEWGLSIVGKIISLRPAPITSVTVGATPAVLSAAAGAATAALAKATTKVLPKANGIPEAATLNAVVEQLLGELAPAEVKGAAGYMLANSNNVPHELDGKLLARCRAALGKNLDDASRRYVRSRVRQRIRELAAIAA